MKSYHVQSYAYTLLAVFATASLPLMSCHGARSMSAHHSPTSLEAWLAEAPTLYTPGTRPDNFSLPDWLRAGNSFSDEESQLWNFLEHPTNDSLIPAALFAVSNLGGAPHSDTLMMYMRSPDQLVRIAAVSATGRLRDYRNANVVLALGQHDREVNVRLSAIPALVMAAPWQRLEPHSDRSANTNDRSPLEKAEVIAALATIATTDEDEDVRLAAREAVAQVSSNHR